MQLPRNGAWAGKKGYCGETSLPQNQGNGKAVRAGPRLRESRQLPLWCSTEAHDENEERWIRLV
jgi:hypothetical protein